LILPYFVIKYHFLIISCKRERHVHIRYMLSPVRLSSAVTFVRLTQAAEIFGNVSSPFGTLAIRWHPRKILQR